MSPSTFLASFQRALLELDRDAAEAIVAQALSLGREHGTIEELIVPALDEIGNRWEKNELSLAEVYMSGRICEALVERLLEDRSPQRRPQPNMAIAVLEDHHILGKRIVHSVVRSAGYHLHDYGRTTVEETVANVKRDRIEVLLLSTLMLPTALRIKEVRRRLADEGLTVTLLVGGAPFRLDPQLYLEVEADATSPTAAGILPLLQGLKGGAA